MENNFYPYLVFIQPDSDADIESLATKLHDFYREQASEHSPKIQREDYDLFLTFPVGYTFNISLADDAVVQQEAIALAETNELDWNEEPFDAEKLKTCHKRFEIQGDPDADMDYFNDSLFILEQVETFTGVIIFSLG